MTAWLRELAADGHIHLIRNRRRLGFAAAADRGIEAAEGHDVVLLAGDTEVPAGWLRRLAAHAYSQPDIATVSPLSDTAAIRGYPADGETPAQIDEICRTVNAGRSVAVPADDRPLRLHPPRRAARDRRRRRPSDFCPRATAAGWQHRIACDTFVPPPTRAPRATRRPSSRSSSP